MPLVKFPIRGGIIADISEYSAGPAWHDANKVRFQQSQPEPIGGYEAESDYNVLGQPSLAIAWRDFSNNDLMAIGTEKRLNLIKNGTVHDITPVHTTSTNVASPPFSVTNESATVTVTDGSYNPSVGDYLVISSAAAVGGITPDGTYEVKTVPSGATYTITHSSNATSTTTGGGASTDIEYLVPTGSSVPTAGLGWGADTWGASTWGTARTESNFTVEPVIWSFDLWGEDLIACRRGGKIYEWDASGGVGTRATAVANSPTTNLFAMVSVPDRHLISFGAHDGANSDRLNIRWTDQEDRTTWTASAVNTAGSQRVQYGERIIAAKQTKEQILVWTDDALFAQVFSGPPFTFTFRPLSTGSSPIGQHSVAEQNSLAFWMGAGNFYVFTGREETLPSPVRDKVFNDFNTSIQFLAYAGINRKFNEIWWFYPSSAATTANDKYVAYNWVTKEWFCGSLNRSTWLDTDAWLTSPAAYDEDGVFYFHEKGKNANGSALNWSIESGAIEIPEAGEELFFIDKFIPDISQQTGDVTLTLYYSQYPNAAEANKTATISSSTLKVNKRVRGRQLRIKYSSSEVESFAKLGILRGNYQPDGLR